MSMPTKPDSNLAAKLIASDVESVLSEDTQAKRAAWLVYFSAGQAAFASALLGLFSFAGALAMQHWMGLEPCPLCIFQRVALLVASMFFALAAPGAGSSHWRRWSMVFMGLGVFFSLIGLAIAMRHMQVMWVPQEASCGPDLAYLMDAFPPSKWLPKVFAGESECAEAAHQMVLGLPIPVWSALVFFSQAAAGFFGWFRLRKRGR